MPNVDVKLQFFKLFFENAPSILRIDHFGLGVCWLVNKTIKTAIHYSRTRQIGKETIFSPNKIFFAKTGWMCYYTPFVVHRQFSHEHIRHWEFFFWRKTSYLSKRPPFWHKSCEHCMTKNLFAEHGEHLLCSIRCTSFFRHFALVS